MIVRSRDRDKVRAAAEAVLRVINDAVEVLVEGHQAARRQMIRQEESAQAGVRRRSVARRHRRLPTGRAGRTLRA